MSSERGYVSLPILLFLLLLLALVFGAAAWLFHLRQPLPALDAYADTLGRVALVRAEVIKALESDQSPDTDSADDPVFGLDGTELAGFRLKIEDASSRLALSWINLNIIENTGLLSSLKSGVSIQQLNDHREEAGYGYDLAATYRDFVREEAFDSLFTPWSWANVNLSSEETLADLFQFRVPSFGAVNGFKAKIRQKFVDLQLWKESELPGLFGADLDQAYPAINVLPMMNINFAPPEIISAVLAYPFPSGTIKNAAAIAANLVEARQKAPIKADQLRARIRVQQPQQLRVFEYFGTRTWFWKISLEAAGRSQEMILAVAPELGAAPSPDRPKGRIQMILLRNAPGDPQAASPSASEGQEGQ